MYNGKPRRWNAVTISIPDNLLDRIDELKGLATRSRYIQRIIEEHLKLMDMQIEA
jgi:metal-responsive CopG/Arc/MetJ family transcriptional regulator